MKRIDSRLGGALVALTVALLGSVTVAVPASADTETDPEGREVCMYVVDDGGYSCYDSVSELKESVSDSGSTLTTEASEAKAAKKKASASSTRFSGLDSTAAATESTYYTIGKLFDLKYWDGDVLFLVTTNSAKCSDGTVYKSNVPGNWNDRANSFEAYYGCRLKVWDYYDWDGESVGWWTSISTLAPINNQVSSYKLKD